VNIDKSRLYRNEPSEIRQLDQRSLATGVHVLATKFGHVLPDGLRAKLQELDRLNQEAGAIEAAASEVEG